MHIHIGALHALSIFSSVIIVGFFWRLLAAHLKDSPVGQAMVFIY